VDTGFPERHATTIESANRSSLIMPKRLGALIVAPANNTTLEAELPALCPALTPMAVARVKRPARTLIREDLPAYAEATLVAVEPFLGSRPDIVFYGCTAAGFLAGPDGDAAMVGKLKARTNAVVVSTAGAMVQALRFAGMSSTAVVTPYLDAVNEGLRAYLEASAITVETLDSFHCKTTDELGRITAQQVLDLALATVTPRSKALFIACSQLPTIGIIEALRARLGIPVWSSVGATAWAGTRALADSAIAVP
jgi:maleate cis-trans isomerase